MPGRGTDSRSGLDGVAVLQQGLLVFLHRQAEALYALGIDTCRGAHQTNLVFLQLRRDVGQGQGVVRAEGWRQVRQILHIAPGA